MQKNSNPVSLENREQLVVVPRDKSLKEDLGFEMESNNILPEVAAADGSTSSSSGDGGSLGCS